MYIYQSSVITNFFRIFLNIAMVDFGDKYIYNNTYTKVWFLYVIIVILIKMLNVFLFKHISNFILASSSGVNAKNLRFFFKHYKL